MPYIKNEEEKTYTNLDLERYQTPQERSALPIEMPNEDAVVRSVTPLKMLDEKKSPALPIPSSYPMKYGIAGKNADMALKDRIALGGTETVPTTSMRGSTLPATRAIEPLLSGVPRPHTDEYASWAQKQRAIGDVNMVDIEARENARLAGDTELRMAENERYAQNALGAVKNSLFQDLIRYSARPDIYGKEITTSMSILKGLPEGVQSEFIKDFAGILNQQHERALKSAEMGFSVPIEDAAIRKAIAEAGGIQADTERAKATTEGIRKGTAALPGSWQERVEGEATVASVLSLTVLYIS